MQKREPTIIRKMRSEDYLFTPFQYGHDGVVVLVAIASLRQSRHPLTGRSQGLLERRDLHVTPCLSAQRAEDGHLAGGIRALDTQRWFGWEVLPRQSVDRGIAIVLEARWT